MQTLHSHYLLACFPMKGPDLGDTVKNDTSAGLCFDSHRLRRETSVIFLWNINCFRAPLLQKEHVTVLLKPAQSPWSPPPRAPCCETDFLLKPGAEVSLSIQTPLNFVTLPTGLDYGLRSHLNPDRLDCHPRSKRLNQSTQPCRHGSFSEAYSLHYITSIWHGRQRGS